MAVGAEDNTTLARQLFDMEVNGGRGEPWESKKRKCIVSGLLGCVPFAKMWSFKSPVSEQSDIFSETYPVCAIKIKAVRSFAQKVL